MYILLAILIVIIMIIIINFICDSNMNTTTNKKMEKFNIPKPSMSEYIPQNMSVSEYKQINKWDYPGYLTAEHFDNIYPGERITVNCFDADYVGMSSACDFQGPYIQDVALYNVNDKDIDSDNPYSMFK